MPERLADHERRLHVDSKYTAIRSSSEVGGYFNEIGQRLTAENAGGIGSVNYHNPIPLRGR
jgi:hypothetical protein